MKNKRWFDKGLLCSPSVLALIGMYLSPPFAQSSSHGDWHMGRWMMDDWGMSWFGMILMLIFWLLVIAGIVLLIRWLVQNMGGKTHSAVGTGSHAMDILKERYAKGEITLDEFESMKKEILR